MSMDLDDELIMKEIYNIKKEIENKYYPELYLGLLDKEKWNFWISKHIEKGVNLKCYQIKIKDFTKGLPSNKGLTGVTIEISDEKWSIDAIVNDFISLEEPINDFDIVKIKDILKVNFTFSKKA